MTRRAFNANPPAGIDRCSVTINLRVAGASKEQKESAQCMRRAVVGGMCRQHARMDEADRRAALDVAEAEYDRAELERQSQPVSRWDAGYDGEG